MNIYSITSKHTCLHWREVSGARLVLLCWKALVGPVESSRHSRPTVYFILCSNIYTLRASKRGSNFSLLDIREMVSKWSAKKKRKGAVVENCRPGTPYRQHPPIFRPVCGSNSHLNDHTWKSGKQYTLWLFLAMKLTSCCSMMSSSSKEMLLLQVPRPLG